MEESFPRGGKRSSDSSSKIKNDGGPSAKKKRFGDDEKRTKSGGKKSKRAASPDATAALWTGKLISEICISDLHVLGCVRTILEDSVLLELPDGLRAMLSITNVSSILTDKLLRQRKLDSSVSTGDEEKESVRLKDYFAPGQLIGCKIIPTVDGGHSDKKKKTKKRQTRFEVTVDPDSVNSNLSFGSIVEGMVLNGAVRCIEEKGYLIDLGVGSSAPGSFGFLPFDQHRSNGGGGTDAERLRVGQVLLCAVTDAPSTDADSDKRVIRLSTLPSTLNGNSDFKGRTLRKEQYSPGLVVKAVVNKVIPSKGLIVQLAQPGGGHSKGFVSKFRLQHGGSQVTDYKPKQSLKVAVLYSIVNSTVFGLSAESHLTVRAADVGARMDLFDIAHVGDLADGRVTASNSKAVIFELLHSKQKKISIFAKAGRKQLEMDDDQTEADDVEVRYSIDSKHRFRITGYSLIDRMFLVDTRKQVLKQPVVDVESCVPGTLVQATVWKNVSDRGVFVRLYDRINGYIPFLHCHDGALLPGVLKRLDQKFKPGKVIKARILFGDVEKNRIVLTAKKKLASSSLPTMVNNFDPTLVDQQADGFIVQINAERGLLVAFYGRARGWLPKSELEKFGYAINRKLSEAFYLGQVVRVRIREVDPAKERMLLSPAEPAKSSTGMDASDKENSTTVEIKTEIKNEPIASASTRKGGALCLGKVYTAVITKIHQMQLDVLLENRHHGRVFVTEISDSFAQGSVPVSNYCVGQAVMVKVIGIRIKHQRKRKRKELKKEVLGADDSSGKKPFHYAECTMKKTKIMAKRAKKNIIGYKDTFKKSEFVPTVVEEFLVKDGVIDGIRAAVNPAWKGDIPLLQLSTDLDALLDPRGHFSLGQIITTRVLGAEDDKKHLKLTCLPTKATIVSLGVKTKALVVSGGDSDDDEDKGIKCKLIDGSYGFVGSNEFSNAEEVVPGQILEIVPIGKLPSGKWQLSTKNTFPVGHPKEIKAEPATFESKVSKTSIRAEEDDDDDVKPVMWKTAAASDAARKMKLAAGFSWDSGRFSMANLMNLCLDESAAEETSSSKEPATSKKTKKETKSRFERAKMEEDELLQKEMALLNPDRELDTSDDFDRLVMGSPDSSLVWIRYMAFFLQRGDVEKAKAVAERALKTISVREDKERFNVWTALLNLENSYGSSESFRKAFDEAVKVNDALQIYQLGTKILRQSNKTEQCDKLFDEMLFKFKPEFEVWVSMGDYFMATRRADKARDLMKRAMRSLPQSRHVDLISRFAQLEYRYSKDEEKTNAVGDPERGRTLFENVLRDCPKRTDVWSVYIDMTSKYQGVDEARPIFERITSMKLNIHNMRLFYKKWLEMEERLGNSTTLAQVKKRAAEYVQDSLAMLPSTSANDDEDEEDVEANEDMDDAD